MAKQDYYALLGVAKSASADELKRAYRKSAMKYHPDRNPGDKAAEDKFKELSEAYDVLSDPQKRAAYDQFGHAAFENGGGGGGRGGFRQSAGGFDFGDIFEEFFGGRGGGGRSRGPSNQGADQRFNLEISLEDAFEGKNVEVRVPGIVACDDCEGTGAGEGGKAVNCNQCNGIGRVRVSQGFFTIERTCPSCQGQGQTIDKPCGKCSGQGRIRKDRNLQVEIPRGVDEGSKIRLSGEGEAGPRGGPAGDLYIFISLKPHNFFERQREHLFAHIPLSMVDAALGGEIEVPTIDGTRARVTIPAGTQTGRQFRLRGKGMMPLRGQQRGDMYIEVEVETPVDLTGKQKELLTAFREEGGASSRHSPASGGFFAKVKELWNEIKD